MPQSLFIFLQLLFVAFCVYHVISRGTGPLEVALLLAAGAIGLRLFTTLH